MQSRNISEVVRLWVNNRFLRDVESQTRLSEDNVDRRKRVDQLSESDRTLLKGIHARMNNQDKQN